METYSSEFPPQNELFKFIFAENYNFKQQATSLKSRMQKIELKNIHFLMRYRKNIKRQNSHRITWRRKKIKSV